MRIRSITIGKWRNFENIHLNLEADTPLVCVVGANGTGKSHLLELIAACAHRLGLSQGIDIPRGDPFADPHHFSFTFYLAKGVSTAVDEGLTSDAAFDQWDRTVTLQSNNLPSQNTESIRAGGVTDQAQSVTFAARVVEALRASEDVHFLSLDADRAYPKRNYNIHEVAAAYEIDWGGAEYTKGRSFRTTTTLYDEWIKYFLASENQAGTRLIQDIRKARKLGAATPTFEDHFADYATSVQKVLPHLLFTGVDSKGRTLLFDSTGLQLAFNQLSGGEREIAFLIGQIDRFRLREGLFLIDEPELHLNSDLIRTWVGHLISTVSVGQIWLATHSLEAVEAAGQRATFILERNPSTRKVDSLARLDTRPVISALSRAVGTPAFSISQLKFAFIEGEENLGERERFRGLTNLGPDFRFMECGACTEVTRRVAAIRTLAKTAGTEIHIGGIVDRDFRSKSEAEALAKSDGIFVLPVHELENFFLHPELLLLLLEQNGHKGTDSNTLILNAADQRAGSWIFQYAMSTPNAKPLSEISPAAKDRAKALTWDQISSDREKAKKQILDASGFDVAAKQSLNEILEIAINAFERQRSVPELWKICEGKQVLNQVARDCGFSGTPSLISAAIAAWNENKVKVSQELLELRGYVQNL